MKIIQMCIRDSFYDSKTILQEVVQAAHKEVVYEIIGESGPEHDLSLIHI